MDIGFREKLAIRQQKTNSLVCVGLDPILEKIPEFIKGSSWSRTLVWLKEIVDATIKFTSMFKPQKAHYEAIPEGQKALQGIVDYIHFKYPEVPVFLDCKRGDIDRTQDRYRIAHFEIDGVDGMNFSPYMGKDCMEKLIDYNNVGRAIVGLCYTSNKSARPVQDVLLSDGRAYWEFIAESILIWAADLGILSDAGLVMAAAYENPKGSGNVFSSHLSKCREIVGERMWFLIPGIGTQEGFVKETVRASFIGWGSIAINSSSGITNASSGRNFAEAAFGKAFELQDQIYQYIKI